MSETQKLADVEALARMAARLAGRSPDEHVSIKFAGVTLFDGVAWRHPDFLDRAKQAYRILASPEVAVP